MSDRVTDLQSTLPLLPLRNGVLFPGTTVTLPVGRPRSVALTETLHPGDRVIVGVQREANTDDPTLAQLYDAATTAQVVRVTPVRPGQLRLTLRGTGRVRLREMISHEPFWRAEAETLIDQTAAAQESQALVELVIEQARALELTANQELAQLLQSTTARDQPGLVADAVAGALGLPTEKEVEVLFALETGARLRIVLRLLSEARTMAEIRERVGAEVQREVSKHQREAILRQQLRAIKKELGEDDGEADLDELRRRLDEAKLPEEARKVADRELKRLDSMGAGQAEYHVIRNYLELIADLPWSARAEVGLDLAAVERKLAADHYGLDEPKKRLLEHLAVRQMTQKARGTLLCLVGPPGVGKTSLGQSIAAATGRPLVRIALGGIRDEAEIRGHRRTYVGALPGRIIAALRKAKVKNPILLLDEVDKLGVGWMGSPEAALLEVLDPEQNHTFNDHYLEIPFDLSEVLFICTANALETITPPLRDRLDVVEIQGYTVEEKLHIVRDHLWPQLLDEHGLAESTVELTDAAVLAAITDHTREAGVRQLKRELTRVIRAVALEVAREPDRKAQPRRLDGESVVTYLGKPRFFNEVAERTAVPGVATGLAWTPVGGDILFVETSRMPGKGALEITGQLGDVMKESARAALSYIRSRASELHIDPKFLETQDLHIHVPAGGVPKDGPSAGVTMFTALTSLLTGRRTRSDTAMTGECTLRGRVLPVGGIKAKVLAARRAGIKRVILPVKNRADLDEVPKEVVDELELIFAEDMSEVLAAALESDAAPLGPLVPLAAAPGESGPRLSS